MYLGARKFTGVNTILNIVTYALLFWVSELPINIFSGGFSALALIVYYIFNIYNLERGRVTLDDFVNGGIINVVLVVTSFRIIPIRESVKFFALLFVLQNIYKILIYYFFVKSRNVMIIGKNKEAEEIKEILRDKQMYNIAAEVSLQEIEKVEDIVEKRTISKILITEEIKDRKTIEIILKLKLKGVQVFDYLSFFEKIEEKVPVKAIDEEWILYGSGFDILHANFNKRVKRTIDVTIALGMFIVVLPIMFVSAVIVKLESKGPVLFKQDRIGFGNKSFKIYKFRSMKIHDENKYSKYAQDKDDRITKFGKIMRKTRIDELPQLWNVLKGDMSFVGPRAEWDKLCYEYMEKIPFYNIRHSVKPGLTGWAQVMYPYGMGVDDAKEKLQYDLYYIKNQSLAFDIMVFFKTAKIVIFGRGK